MKATLIYDETKDGEFYPCGYAVVIFDEEPVPVPKEMEEIANAVDDNREAEADNIHRIPCLIDEDLAATKAPGEMWHLDFEMLRRDPKADYDDSEDAVEGDEPGEEGYDEEDHGTSLLAPTAEKKEEE